MFNISSAQDSAQLLDALGDQLAQLDARYEVVVVGGSALLALGLVSRATRDVDLVALRDGSGLLPAAPLPGPLATARDRVARDLGLPEDWLNAGPAALHFKLYATVDQGPGKHEADLRALDPTPGAGDAALGA